MKTSILVLFTFLFYNLSFGQEIIGKKDVSTWKFFSGEFNKPQYKKIDNDKFFTYYRTGPDVAGIIVLDKKLNVIKDISLKLAKAPKIILNAKTYLDLINFPNYYYRKDNNSVVLISNVKNKDKSYIVIALTYSLDSENLIQADTLLTTKSDNFDIKLSQDDKYFIIYERMGKDKSSKDKNIRKQQYNVFSSDCKKLYSAQVDLPKEADSYSIIYPNSELVECYVKEEGRKIEYSFNKFDNKGNLAGTIKFSPSKDDIYNYKISDILQTSNNDFYCVCEKVRDEMEGLVILKLDFTNKICKEIVDKEFTEDNLAKIYNKAELSHSMIEDKKIKPIDELKDFFIHSAYIDNDGIYIITEDTKIKRALPARSGETRVSYSSENIIVLSFGLDEKEKWITAIKRDAGGFDIDNYGMQINFYNPFGSSIALNVFDDGNKINMMVPSLGKVFVTRIDKKTGKDIVPVQLWESNKEYINSNCFYWFDANNVLLTSMMGIYFALSKKTVTITTMSVKN